jgi:hypothetical protein
MENVTYELHKKSPYFIFQSFQIVVVEIKVTINFIYTLHYHG